MAVAGSVVCTALPVPGSDAVTQFQMAWTSDASGNASGTLLQFTPGTIITVEFTPGTGAAQPSDLYDVDFQDADGTSMFNDGGAGSIGANLSNTLSVHRVPFIFGAATSYVRTWLQGDGGGSPYQLLVTNAGDTKSGNCNIFLCSRTL